MNVLWSERLCKNELTLSKHFGILPWLLFSEFARVCVILQFKSQLLSWKPIDLIATEKNSALPLDFSNFSKFLTSSTPLKEGFFGRFSGKWRVVELPEIWGFWKILPRVLGKLLSFWTIFSWFRQKLLYLVKNLL